MKTDKLVIVAKNVKLPDNAEEMLKEHIAAGGKLIIEGASNTALQSIKGILGISEGIVESEDMKAAYLRIEPEGSFLQERTGERPLREIIPIGTYSVCVKLGGREAASVESVIESAEVSYKQDGDTLTIHVSGLDIWDAIVIKCV